MAELLARYIPMLQALGVEDEVRSYSTLKPGATFNLSAEINFSFFVEHNPLCLQ